MKLKNTPLASALLSATAFSVNVATELTPEQAAVVKPFDRVVVTGRFNAISEAVKAVPRHADREGAAFSYVADTSNFDDNDNQRVIADFYRVDAGKAEGINNRVINDVVELPRSQTALIEPFDTVIVQGSYRSRLEVNGAIAKAAKVKGTYSSYIVRRTDASQDGNQCITILICRRNVKKRTVRDPDVIPADSEAERITLAAGGEVAKKVEIPGVTTTVSPSSKVGRFFETQSSRGGRYTATLPGGTKAGKLNKVAATMIVPFNNIRFSGNYGNMIEAPYQIAKRAAKKGAKYYHITRRWQERGNNLIVSIDLYKWLFNYSHKAA